MLQWLSHVTVVVVPVQAVRLDVELHVPLAQITGGAEVGLVKTVQLAVDDTVVQLDERTNPAQSPVTPGGHRPSGSTMPLTPIVCGNTDAVAPTGV